MPDDVAAILADAWQRVTGLVAGLDEADLLRPTHCAGWAVVDVVVHLLHDAQRALMACATPTADPPTVDAVGYWRAWSATTDALAAARSTRFLRVQASAYRGPEGLLAHWRDTSEAAARAVAARDPGERVRTQGHVLTVADLGRTLVVEAVVHHLDCLLDLPDRAGPPPAALALTVATLDGLLGRPLPRRDAREVLRAAGRLTADAPEYPLLG